MLEVLSLVKEGGSQVILAVVLLLVGIPMKNSVDKLAIGIDGLLRDLRNEREDYKLFQQKIQADLQRIKITLQVAYSGSSVPSYQLAAKILNDEEDLSNE